MILGSRGLVLSTISLIFCMAHAQAQRGGPQSAGQNAANTQPGGSSASLQGLSWPQSVWNRDLGLPQSVGDKKTVLACYTMLYGK